VWAALAEALARVAVEILDWYARREDLRAAERGRIALEAARLARVALQWKADHPVVLGPDPLSDFRVQPGGGRVGLPTDRS
jgi:hypothetical protein